MAQYVVPSIGPAGRLQPVALRATANSPAMGGMLVLLCALEAILVACSFIFGSGYAPQVVMGFSVLVAGVLVVYFCALIGRRERANFLAPDLIVVGMLIAFHYPAVLLASMGQVHFPSWWWWGYSSVNPSLVLVTSGVVSFLIGYNILPKKPAAYMLKPVNTAEYSDVWMLVARFFFLAGALLIFYFGATQIGLRELAGGQYNFQKFRGETVDERTWFAGIMFCQVGIMIHATYSAALHGTWIKGTVERVAVLGFYAFVMIAGHRNVIVMSVIAILISYTFLGRHMRMATVIVIALVGSVVMSAGRVIRNLNEKSISRVQDALVQQQEEIGPLSSLVEAGGTIKTVYRTVGVVPSKVPFFLGSTYIDAVLRTVPNVGSAEGGVFVRVPPSRWLMMTTEPKADRRGHGFGFSIIAEAYMNFGVLGPPLVMGLLGWITRRMFDRAYFQRNPFRMLLFVIWTAGLANWVRNDSHVFAKPVVWSFALLFGIRLFLGGRAELLKIWQSDAAGRPLPPPPAPTPAVA